MRNGLRWVRPSSSAASLSRRPPSRSFTPAFKPAPPIDGPCASDEPRDPSSGDLEGREIPAAQPAMGQEIPDGNHETPSPAAAFEEPAQRSVRFEGPPSPEDAPMGQAPELPAAEEVEAVPSKPMPKPPPATMARPNPYRDIRLLPPVTGPSPELIASIDRQMAAEREARIAAAWGEQMAPPKASPPMPTAEALQAFVDWQARQAEADKGGKGKGKQMAAPSPFPQAWGTKGKGKGSGGDPFLPRNIGRGASRERRRDSAKRTRHDRDALAQEHERPRPCKKCGAWYVCRTAPENVARGAKHGHCMQQPRVRPGVRQARARYARVGPANARRRGRPEGAPRRSCGLAPASGARVPRTPDDGHSDTDVSHSAPVSPAPQITAADAAGTAAGGPLLTLEVRAWERSVDWDAVRRLNEEGYQRWLRLQVVRAPAGPTPPQPAPAPGPWDKPAHVKKLASATPQPGEVAPSPAAAGPGEQPPPAQVPGADRPAIRKGGPSPAPG